MANPRRPDPGTHTTDATGTQSGKTWIYGAIAAVVILLLVLVFGGFLGDDTAMQDDVAAPPATEQDDAEVITSDPATTPASTDDAAAPPAAVPETQADVPEEAAPDDTDGTEDDGVIDIQGDADVEVLDES